MDARGGETFEIRSIDGQCLAPPNGQPILLGRGGGIDRGLAGRQELGLSRRCSHANIGRLFDFRGD